MDENKIELDEERAIGNENIGLRNGETGDGCYQYYYYGSFFKNILITK